jgi:hypothetical protein
MPNLELWIGLALTLIGLAVGGVTLYRMRDNRKTDAEVAAHWDDVEHARTATHASPVWQAFPPTPPREDGD